MGLNLKNSLEYPLLTMRIVQTLIPLEKLNALLPTLKAEYANALPFPHTALDDFLDREIAEAILEEFPGENDIRWKNYYDQNQKKQANEAVAATAVWLQTMPWADREVLKRAIGKAVSTAREIDLPTMEKARALEFEQAVGKASIAFRGVKEILALYGLSIDAIFDSVRAEEVSQTEELATVRVNFKLFDKALWHDTEMTRVDGRWYGKQIAHHRHHTLHIGQAAQPES